VTEEPARFPSEAPEPEFEYGDDGMPLAFDPDGADPPEQPEVILDDPLARLLEEE